MLLISNRRAPAYGNIVVIPAYAGPLLRLKRQADAVTFDVYPNNITNTVAVLLWATGQVVSLDGYYDQNTGARVDIGSNANPLIASLSALLGGLTIQV